MLLGWLAGSSLKRKTAGVVCAVLMVQQVQAVYLNMMTPPLAYNLPFFARKKDPAFFEFGGIGYHRMADGAYAPCHMSTTVKSLAGLFFGKDQFTIAQAFPDSTVGSSLPTNPFVSVVHLQPQMIFEEDGVFFKAQVFKRFGSDQDWCAGVRTALPYRSITVQETQNSNSQGKGDVDDFFATRQEIPAGATSPVTSFAARLDFLSALDVVSFNDIGQSVPMVVYADVSSNDHITIAGQDITGTPTTSMTPAAVVPSVAAVASDGSLPFSQRWGDYPSAITTTVTASGRGVYAGARGGFAESIDYTPLASNISAQSHLIIVPSLSSPNNGMVHLAAGAQTILSQVQAALGDIENSAGAFLEQYGVTMVNGHNQGFGNLDIELFLGHDWCEGALHAELNAGIRLPTDRQIQDNRNLLQQPTGNGKHTELRLGAGGIWRPCAAIACDVNLYYTFVLKHTELFAAPFVGATVKNLLPPFLPTELSWDYFLGNIDLTIYANSYFGFDIGYLAYVKTRDRVQLSQTQALDLIGNLAPLDHCVLERATMAVNQRIKTEFFVTTAYGDLFTGFAQTLAGKNSARETDYYLGVRMNF